MAILSPAVYVRSAMRAVCLIIAFSVVGCAIAQPRLSLKAESDANTVMVRGFPSDSVAGAPVLQAIWRFPADTPCTFAYQRLSSAYGDRSLTLRELLLT